jgi:hypothetical protein
MLAGLDELLSPWATWPLVALLLAVSVLFFLLFGRRRKALGQEQGQLLDERPWGYSPRLARQWFATLGVRGRNLYAISQLSLDVVFVGIYGTLFGFLLVLLYAPGTARILLLAPLLTMAADLLEDVLTAALAWSYHENGRPLPWDLLCWTAACCTLAKFLLFLLSFVIVLVGLVLRL